MNVRKWWNKLVSFFRRKPKEERGIKLTRGGAAKVTEPVGRAPRTPQPRTTIRPSDIGFRKLSRHRSGRQFEKRSGIDHNKGMVDIKDGDTRPPRKKGGWDEDRGKRG